MKIALDYDRTYTAAPELWDIFVDHAHDMGHEVRIVTARHFVHDNIDDRVHADLSNNIIYCDGVAKKFYCHHTADWNPDIWIDDKPENITQNGPLTRDQLKQWRDSPEYNA